MIRSCLELVDRIFEVAHCTVVLLDLELSAHAPLVRVGLADI